MERLHRYTVWQKMNSWGEPRYSEHGCECGFRSRNANKVVRHIRRETRREDRARRRMEGN